MQNTNISFRQARFSFVTTFMRQVYLGLGTNLGDRLINLETAVASIAKKVGQINACSSIYQTAAWGNTHQPDFLNMVVGVETNFNPETLFLAVLVPVNKFITFSSLIVPILLPVLSYMLSLASL